MKRPKNIELIGNELCIVWADNSEGYIASSDLRANSPSAENVGEQDILGNQYGGTDQKEFPDVTILGWDFIGNYALQVKFSDGHNTGLYSWDLLHKLTQENAKA